MNRMKFLPEACIVCSVGLKWHTWPTAVIDMLWHWLQWARALKFIIVTSLMGASNDLAVSCQIVCDNSNELVAWILEIGLKLFYNQTQNDTYYDTYKRICRWKVSLNLKMIRLWIKCKALSNRRVIQHTISNQYRLSSRTKQRLSKYKSL